MSIMPLRFLKRHGAITLSDEALDQPDASSEAPPLAEILRRLGVVSLSTEAAQMKGRPLAIAAKVPTQATEETGQASKKRDWLDGLDILYKVGVAAIGTVWAIHTFAVQKDNLLLQLKTQDDTFEYQRRMSQAQFAASVIPSISDDPVLRRTLAIAMLSAIAPKHAVDFSRLTTDPKASVATTDPDSLEQKELDSLFSAYLADARKCQDYQLFNQAAKQYIKAWNTLPERFVIADKEDSPRQQSESVIDGDLIDAAIESYKNGDAKAAVIQFSKAFKNVVVP